MKLTVNRIKSGIAIFCVSCAMICAFIALYIPPQGVIHSSVLWFIAQTLLFVGSLLGVEVGIIGNKGFFKIKLDKKEEDED
jgi:hypothetical protein